MRNDKKVYQFFLKKLQINSYIRYQQVYLTSEKFLAIKQGMSDTISFIHNVQKGTSFNRN